MSLEDISKDNLIRMYQKKLNYITFYKTFTVFTAVPALSYIRQLSKFYKDYPPYHNICRNNNFPVSTRKIIISFLFYLALFINIINNI